jgi:hypothetical protein
MHLKCGGYIKKKNKEPQSAVHRLLPLMPKVPVPPTTAIPLSHCPTPKFFTNDEEYRYFKVFCDTTASNLAEYLDSTLWNTIVLQGSEQESFIRDAVIALGALNKTVETVPEGGEFPRGQLSSGAVHYQAAFQQYGKSIKGIRKACAERRQNKRTILIACLLAICFEYFDGNIDPAIAHIRSGIMLINEWFWSIMHVASVDEQQQHFLPGIIEDELVCVFSRLEVDVFTWYDTETVVMHEDLARLAIQIIQAIPREGFSNIHSARKYFDIMLREVDWLVRSINDQLWASWGESTDSRQEKTVDNPLVIVPSADQQDHVESLKHGLVSWFNAFQPLYVRSLTSGGNDILVNKALYLRHTCSSIALDCCFGPELSYDSYMPKFQTALSLAETLSAATFSKSKPTFVVWSILVKSLYFVALKCRNRSLRREAITRLQSMTRREGLWDARVASAVAKKVMKLEDGEGDQWSDFVPEYRRLRGIKTSFDLHKRQGNLRYLQIRTESEAVSFVAGQVELSW